MGESIVEAPIVEDKMRGSVNSGSALGVSVSFGRFESDSLSWEKWSSFSPNKYLEEVEKCATPGSVAQKKAYFEAHYKKIAARKIEEMEQEKQIEARLSNKDDENDKDLFEKPYEDDDQGNSLTGFKNSSHFEGSNESSTITVDSQCSIIDQIVDSRSSMNGETTEEVIFVPKNTELNKLEPPILELDGAHGNEIEDEIVSPAAVIEELIHVSGYKERVESQKNLEKQLGKTTEKGKEKMDLGTSKKSPKITSSDKEKSLTETKKRLLPRLPKKFPEVSASKTLKPSSSTSKESHSQPLTKKANGSLLPRSKNITASNKVAAPSLHMSLSFGPANDDSTSLPTTRRPLIMERMGDKDIVKRAFKSFQNSYNQRSAFVHPISSVRKEVPTTKPDGKVCGSLTLKKENEGVNRGPRKLDDQRAQLGRSLNSSWTKSYNCDFRSLKGISMDQRRAKPAPSSFGFRNDERTGKRKDLSKKLVEKSSAKEVEKARLSSKSKGQEAEIKRPQQNLNFKATPMPSFYNGQVILKSSSEKNAGRPTPLKAREDER